MNLYNLIMKKIFFTFLVFITSISYCQTAEFLIKRGISKHNLEQYKDAIEDYTKAIIESKSNYSKAYYYRGLTKLSNKDYKGALSDYTQSIEINPNDSQAYCDRGIVKIHLNQKDSACIDFNKAIELGNLMAKYLIKDYCE